MASYNAELGDPREYDGLVKSTEGRSMIRSGMMTVIGGLLQDEVRSLYKAIAIAIGQGQACFDIDDALDDLRESKARAEEVARRMEESNRQEAKRQREREERERQMKAKAKAKADERKRIKEEARQREIEELARAMAEEAVAAMQEQENQEVATQEKEDK